MRNGQLIINLTNPRDWQLRILTFHLHADEAWVGVPNGLSRLGIALDPCCGIATSSVKDLT